MLHAEFEFFHRYIWGFVSVKINREKAAENFCIELQRNMPRIADFLDLTQDSADPCPVGDCNFQSSSLHAITYSLPCSVC